MMRDSLRNTYVENKDAVDIIERYYRENTFFFCNPPYYETSGYKEKFTKENHVQLRNISGKFLLTVNDNEEIRRLYDGFNIKEVRVNYSVSRQKEARKDYSE